MPITKSDLSRHNVNSFEYVVLHARWQRSRGRKPSATLPAFGVRNANAALRMARRSAYFPKPGGLYLSGKTPDDYVCSRCKLEGHKLWRESHTFNPKLLCATCAATNQKKDIGEMDGDGMHYDSTGMRSDQIGWYLPAVPTEDDLGYWGYTSVPEAGCRWWRNLPTRFSKSVHKDGAGKTKVVGI